MVAAENMFHYEIEPVSCTRTDHPNQANMLLTLSFGALRTYRNLTITHDKIGFV